MTLPSLHPGSIRRRSFFAAIVVALLSMAGADLFVYASGVSRHSCLAGRNASRLDRGSRSLRAARRHPLARPPGTHAQGSRSDAGLAPRQAPAVRHIHSWRIFRAGCHALVDAFPQGEFRPHRPRSLRHRHAIDDPPSGSAFRIRRPREPILAPPPSALERTRRRMGCPRSCRETNGVGTAVETA